MGKVIKFYRTEGRSVVYAQNNRKNHLAVISENWRGTKEVKVKKGFLFITYRAFHYVPELLNAHGIKYEIVKVSKDQEDTVKNVIMAIKNHEKITLKGVYICDYNGYGAEMWGVNTTLCLELEDFYIEVDVFATALVRVFLGDYFTPATSETEWGDIEMDELKIWFNDNDKLLKLNKVQNEAIYNAIEELIDLR